MPALVGRAQGSSKSARSAGESAIERLYDRSSAVGSISDLDGWQEDDVNRQNQGGERIVVMGSSSDHAFHVLHGSNASAGPRNGPDALARPNSAGTPRNN